MYIFEHTSLSPFSIIYFVKISQMGIARLKVGILISLHIAKLF